MLTSAAMPDWFSYLVDASKLPELIRIAGYYGLTAIIFVETGLLVGFFLPGDSLLVTAGIVISAHPDWGINLFTLMFLLSTAAILGDTLGYYIGYKAGPLIFNKEKSFFFRKNYLIKAKEFYEKHGGKTIVIARFIPIIRTFAPVVAGVGKMEYRKFLAYNVFGGIGWVVSLLSVGYFLGQVYPDLGKRIELVAIIVILLSILPGIIEFIKIRKAKKKENQSLGQKS